MEPIGRLAPAGSEPDVDIRGDSVTVLLRAFKGEAYGLTQADLKPAPAISTDRRAILRFWQAVLAYDPRPDSPDEDLVDRHGRGAPFWFENMDELRSDGRGTIHPVVCVQRAFIGRAVKSSRPARQIAGSTGYRGNLPQ